MTKGEELIALLKEHYKSGQVIESFIGECRYSTSGLDVNCSGCTKEKGQVYITNLFYDEENDTLTTWGYGLLLLYKDGQWASPKLNNITLSLYEIY